MKRSVYHVLLLFIIISVAYILRVYQVQRIPPALSWDEVSIGYNAYSILKTGYDEHQRRLPLDTFVAYGDYKPPLPIYLTVGSIALFGLNEFAVRFPSVIAGTLTVLFTYFLARQLFTTSFLSPLLTSHISLLTSLLLAISPWHIQLSRAGFEANIATMFIVLGVWLVLVASREPRWYIAVPLPFVASVYTFNSARYFAPLLLVGLFVYQKASVVRSLKYVSIGAVITLISLLPIMPHLLSKEARLRFDEVNIFTDPGIVVTANVRMDADANSWWAKALHNRRLGYAKSYLIHFLDNFELRFLFIRGDGNPKFSIQDVGQLYLVELPFLILGIFWLFRRNNALAWLFLYWMFAAVVPAATARETPHALRIENGIVAWYAFIGFGWIASVQCIQRYRYRRFFVVGSVLALIINFSYYFHNYYGHYSTEFSAEWQYGYREAIVYAKQVKRSYDSIVITESIGRPYMYALFYEQFNPKSFWQTKDATFDAAGFYQVRGFDTYRFVRNGVIRYEKNVLYILDPQFVPPYARVLTTIPLLNGEARLVVFEI